ncbi:PIR Superfamily Protein [Plasmodium ovale wallikeri]|uniref:PIR Superfamily Protein n=2 Tax=Plasmodium ovale TaxID=36330 RepID=A0A1A9AGR6_PLAOA|nr:PIR Superfamily Protein [Plasmodium ovale wallikeri]SBT56838.1 PIR Superfamily Protein [Plasmodium ovale wallikeri]SBT73635.1 PIR protein [Plasmodium ovale]
MGCINGSGKENYKFLRNAHYYGNLPQGFDKDALELKKKEVCDYFLNDTNLSEDSSAKDICKDFLYIYNYLNKINESRKEDKSLTHEDCHFMNYWLNVNIRDKNIDAKICVNDFYDKLKSKDESFFSSPTKLEEHLHVIDTDTLENMELLYKLYDNAVKIMSIISNEYYINEEEKQKEQDSCSEYTKECDENYKKAMDRCLNSNVDFYNALKNFKDAYDIIAEPSSNKSNACDSSEFYYFPEYDAILEKKANVIKISSTLLLLSFALPLIYKYTPFGPFLRAKINRVKDRWMNTNTNVDELLPLSTDIEEIIFDNENYNIGYYSETN